MKCNHTGQPNVCHFFIRFAFFHWKSDVVTVCPRSAGNRIALSPPPLFAQWSLYWAAPSELNGSPRGEIQTGIKCGSKKIWTVFSSINFLDISRVRQYFHHPKVSQEDAPVFCGGLRLMVKKNSIFYELCQPSRYNSALLSHRTDFWTPLPPPPDFPPMFIYLPLFTSTFGVIWCVWDGGSISLELKVHPRNILPRPGIDPLESRDQPSDPGPVSPVRGTIATPYPPRSDGFPWGVVPLVVIETTLPSPVKLSPSINLFI